MNDEYRILKDDVNIGLRRCGTCDYYEHEGIDDGYVCVNAASIYCTEWVNADDVCDAWIPKRKGQYKRK